MMREFGQRRMRMALYKSRDIQCVQAVDADQQNVFYVYPGRAPLGGRQDVVWGLGYRLIGIGTRGGAGVSFNPANRNNQLFSAFVQDEVTVIEDRFKITLGSKLEHNDYTGIEVQPSVRALWTPSDRQSLWAAVSRAVRTPSPAELTCRRRLPTSRPGYRWPRSS